MFSSVGKNIKHVCRSWNLNTERHSQKYTKMILFCAIKGTDQISILLIITCNSNFMSDSSIMMQVNGLFSSRCVNTTIISTDVSFHYSDVIMSAMVSNHQPRDCLLNRLDADKKNKHQSSASLAFVGGIHWWPFFSPHKGPVMQKMFPFDDVIMWCIKHK